MNQRSRIVALVAIAAGLVAYLRRPVRQPDTVGTWHPADAEKTRR